MPYGIEECALYPVFTPELLDLMRRLIPRERWTRVARAVTFMARKAGPGARARRAAPAGALDERGAPADSIPVSLQEPDAVCNFGATGCEEGVLLKIRNLLATLGPWQILEIRSTDPGVREDLPAWCRLTGQQYLGASGSRYFVRKR